MIGTRRDVKGHNSSDMFNQDISYGITPYSQHNAKRLSQESAGKSPGSDVESRKQLGDSPSSGQRSPRMNTPEQQLISAIYKRNYEDALRLVRENTYYETAGSILSVACYVNDLRLIELLLQQPGFRSHINRLIQGHALLHKASVKGDAKLARLLIQYGADPNLQNEYGQSALHLAVLSNNHELHSVLLGAITPGGVLETSQLANSAESATKSPKIEKQPKHSTIDSQLGLGSGDEDLQHESIVKSTQIGSPLGASRRRFSNEESQLDIQRLNQVANLQAEREELLKKLTQIERSNAELLAALELSKARDSQNELRNEESRQKYAETVQKYNELLNQYETRLKDAGKRHDIQQQELQAVCVDLRQKYNNALLQADHLAGQLRDLQELQKIQKIQHADETQTLSQKNIEVNESCQSSVQEIEKYNEKIQDLQNEVSKANQVIQQLQDEKAQLSQQLSAQKKTSQIKTQQEKHKPQQNDYNTLNINDQQFNMLKNENDELKRINSALANERDQLLEQIQELFKQSQKPQIHQTICSCGFVIILLTTIIIIGAAMLSNARLHFGFEKLDRGTDLHMQGFQ